MLEFDEFILDAALLDLPLRGRQYTWSKLDGPFMSRIDRFLISKKWIVHWQNCSQWCLDKGLSDHCPILLCERSSNWGPKSFCMFKCWRELEGYQKYLEEKWNSFKIQGWGGFVLKEKFKLLKNALKE